MSVLGEGYEGLAQTICFAAMQTVLMENLRPHMSNRSSRLGPRRSMTRMLWSPSCPKWYICGIPSGVCVWGGTNERVVGCTGEWTYDNRRGCGRSGTHRAVGVPLPCAAPAQKVFKVGNGTSVESTHKLDSNGLVVQQVGSCDEDGEVVGLAIRKTEGIPSKMTPKEPSPIFLPTR